MRRPQGHAGLEVRKSVVERRRDGPLPKVALSITFALSFIPDFASASYASLCDPAIQCRHSGSAPMGPTTDCPANVGGWFQETRSKRFR
jgi:hypothetical protein